MFIPFRRATLLIPSGPAHDLARNHLFVLLTNPVEQIIDDVKVKNTLLTSISSVPANSPFDSTCILNLGDHPFIRHDSYVFYAMSRIETTQSLIDGVDAGTFTHKEIMDESVAARICAGLTESPHTTRRILDFYNLATK
jgi:hypothetical protein